MKVSSSPFFGEESAPEPLLVITATLLFLTQKTQNAQEFTSYESSKILQKFNLKMLLMQKSTCILCRDPQAASFENSICKDKIRISTKPKTTRMPIVMIQIAIEHRISTYAHKPTTTYATSSQIRKNPSINQSSMYVNDQAQSSKQSSKQFIKQK